MIEGLFPASCSKTNASCLLAKSPGSSDIGSFTSEHPYLTYPFTSTHPESCIPPFKHQRFSAQSGAGLQGWTDRRLEGTRPPHHRVSVRLQAITGKFQPFSPGTHQPLKRFHRWYTRAGPRCQPLSNFNLQRVICDDWKYI